jgi:hypothetical protein
MWAGSYHFRTLRKYTNRTSFNKTRDFTRKGLSTSFGPKKCPTTAGNHQTFDPGAGLWYPVIIDLDGTTFVENQYNIGV